MHDEGIGLGARELLLVEAEEAEILPHRRHEGAIHALALEPQHHHHICVFECFFHVVEDFHAHLSDTARQQC